MPSLYIILGAAGSGRREILINLAESPEEEEPAERVFYVRSSELPSSFDDGLTNPQNRRRLNWEFTNDLDIVSQPPPPSTSEIFFLTEGQTNPVDQIEALKPWIIENKLTLARIITVVDCQLCYTHPGAKAWFQCCIHFSDIVLLNRRTEVPNQWIKEFQDSYERDRYPCLFQYVKKGKVTRPEMVLFPEARRLSLFFDDLEEPELPSDIEIEGALPLEDEEEVLMLDSDPYLARFPNGQRKKRIPDISKFLQPAP